MRKIPLRLVSWRAARAALAATLLGSLASLGFACGSKSDSGADPSWPDGDGGGAEADGGDAAKVKPIEGPEFDDGGGSDGSGGTGQTCAATALTAQKADVDIIFFVDTSGSMSEEIAQIKININSFAQTIGTSGLDYRVIMIGKKQTGATAGTYDICVVPPLGGPACADNPPRFYHINEQVLSTDGLRKLLSTYDSTWKNYVRPTAYKAFIAITDDNSSLGYQAFDQQLLAKLPAGMFGDATKRLYIMNSIVGWTDGTPVLNPQKCRSAVNIGANYQELSKLTGGIVDSVCKASFDSVFKNIANGIVTRLGCELTVPKSDGGVTDPDKVVVVYTPSATGSTAETLPQLTDASKCAQIPNGWHYDNNANPTKIILCATKCTAVSGDLGGKLEVKVGCRGNPPQ